MFSQLGSVVINTGGKAGNMRGHSGWGLGGELGWEGGVAMSGGVEVMGRLCGGVGAMGRGWQGGVS